LEREIDDLDELLAPLLAVTAPDLLALFGVGPDTAAALLVAAGDNPERLHSEAAWAHLCGVSPLQASSGKVTRHRLDRGGDRQANSALWRIAMVRIAHDPETTAYFERRVKEGRSKPEVIRILKRYIAREVYSRVDFPATRRPTAGVHIHRNARPDKSMPSSPSGSLMYCPLFSLQSSKRDLTTDRSVAGLGARRYVHLQLSIMSRMFDWLSAAVGVLTVTISM
jgi:hypothetical protein